MARIRTIKPEAFLNEDLWDLAEDTGLPVFQAYVGLWTQADRQGRFEWKPRRLKAAILPYWDDDFSRVLDALTTRGFLVRYACQGREFGAIPTFTKHQVINNRESDSSIPPPPENPNENAVLTREPRVDDASATREPRVPQGREGKGKEGKGPPQPPEGGDLVGPAHPPDLDFNAWNRWLDYRREIRKPLKPASIPAAQRKLAAMGPNQAQAVENSISNGWQGLFEPKESPPAKASNGESWGPDHWI